MLFSLITAATKTAEPQHITQSPLKRRSFAHVVLVFELILMVITVSIAWWCNSWRENRLIHVLFAMLSPVFYLLYAISRGCETYEDYLAKKLQKFAPDKNL